MSPLPALLLLASAARAALVPLPGATGWEADGACWRVPDGALAASGTGEAESAWRTPPLLLRPDGRYVLTFRARVPGGNGGTPVSGPAFCNRDLGALGPAWARVRSVFRAPADARACEAPLRFGQWHLAGTALFDSFRLASAGAVHTRAGELELGAGERLSGTRYEFRAPLGGEGGNDSRPLLSHHCGFNTNRWVFAAGREVTYRHELAGRRLTAAMVEVAIGYHERGELVVEAQTGTATAWLELGTLRGPGGGAYPVPAAWLPAAAVDVRLRARASRDAAGRSDPGSFQVDAYAFRASVTGPPAELRGSTRYLAVLEEDPRLSVEVTALGDGLPGGENRVTAWITNRSRGVVPIRPQASARRDGQAQLASSYQVDLRPRREQFQLPYQVEGPGEYELALSLGPQAAYRAETSFRVPELYRSGFGERLPESSQGVSLWWASSGWKVSESCAEPAATGPAIVLHAARREVEDAQLVVRTQLPLRGFLPTAGPLRGPRNAVIPATAVEFLRARYVEVEQATDGAGAPGRWPDPLPPFRAPADLAPGLNHPVWIRVTVPPGIPAGTYAGTVRLAAERYHASATLLVEVFDFDLPEEPALKSAFGFDAGLAWRYHGATDDASRRAVLERYWGDFAAHRISPFAYGTAPLDPPVTAWTMTADGAGPVPRLEWDAWEREMGRLFATHHFGAFALEVPGLGGDPPELAGFREGTTGYDAAFSRWCDAASARLAAKGWLDRAFVYWIDEPAERDFPRVMTGMRRLADRLPGVARLLTKEPRPELEGPGAPNLWCPILDAWDGARAAERRRAGDRFWWYVCTGPKAPYPGEFIDHAAPELRVWCWQTWAERVEGILIWATDYWTTPAAYPEPALQDPYRDPMSWVREAPPGTRQAWGNGDGRFLYPPEDWEGPAPRRGSGPMLEGPVDSIRWEQLRDGVEDYDYLALLRSRLAARGAALPAPERARLAALLAVPPAVATGLTTFTRTPEPIEARRREVAAAIVALGR